MTANPAKPARYRPGKPVAPEVSSDEDVDEEEEEEAEDVKPAEAPASIPPPNVTSFRPDATRMADSLKKVDLTERRRQAAAEETTRLRVQEAQRAQDEEGFVTEGSEEEEGSDEGSASESGEDDKSSEEEQPKRPLLRPTFIKKNKRQLPTALAQLDLEEARRRKEEDERKQAADETVQEQIRKDAEARAAGKKYWDDEEVGEEDEVDDRDGIDPDAELAAWKLRELKRIKRDREAIEQAEKEREEIERRRNLTTDEREAEDREYLARQKEEKEGKGKMGYMQKYFHRGAFFQDDAKAKGLDQRDIMGSRYQDDTNREILPEYMQIRDMARLGRKGRTRYRDLKTEDTGRWGQIGDDRRQGPGRGGKEFVSDDRFRPDRGGAGGGATGANASAVGERRRVDGAPEGPRALRAPPPGGGGDSYRPRDRSEEGDQDDGRTPAPRPARSHHERSPPSRKHRARSRTRSRSRSRSRRRRPSPRRHRRRSGHDDDDDDDGDYEDDKDDHGRDTYRSSRYRDSGDARDRFAGERDRDGHHRHDRDRDRDRDGYHYHHRDRDRDRDRDRNRDQDRDRSRNWDKPRDRSKRDRSPRYDGGRTRTGYEDEEYEQERRGSREGKRRRVEVR